jgi:hypothetical protein
MKSLRIGCVPVEIRKRHLPNRRQKPYHWSNIVQLANSSYPTLMRRPACNLYIDTSIPDEYMSFIIRAKNKGNSAGLYERA